MCEAAMDARRGTTVSQVRVRPATHGHASTTRTRTTAAAFRSRRCVSSGQIRGIGGWTAVFAFLPPLLFNACGSGEKRERGVTVRRMQVL